MVAVMQICKVNIGRVFSSRTKWKADFCLFIYCEIPHLTLLGLAEKMFYCIFKESRPCLWPDETSAYEPYLTTCSSAALGNNVSSWTEMKLLQSIVLVLRASYRGMSTFWNSVQFPPCITFHFLRAHLISGLFCLFPPHLRYHWPSYPASW